MRQHTLRTPLRAKRGSLSLSINAIVIIVLAMTLLGLGLGFIRGLFKNIGETTGTVQEQVKQQILEDLKTGDKKLSFSTNSLQMESSGSQTITVGVRNSKSSASAMDFIAFVESQQYKATDGTKIVCTRDTLAGITPTTLPGADAYECDKFDSAGALESENVQRDDSEVTDIDRLEFFYDIGPFSLSADDAEVYPIRVTSDAGTKGTFLVKISVYENINDDRNDPDVYGEKPDPADDPSNQPSNEVYAEKTFFITVS